MTFLTIGAANKDIKCKKNFVDNQFHNILRFCDVLPNFLLITSEKTHDYYLQTWYIRVAS